MPEQKKVFLQKPQINISYSSFYRMWLVFFCAFAAVIQSALSDGGASLIPAVTALIAAVLTEFLLTYKRHGAEKIKDGSAAATAMIFTLMLPNHIHPVYVVLGVLFAIIIVKYSFGGLGANWLNPALGGWLFVRFSWPKAFNDALRGASDFIYEINASHEISAMDNSVTEFLNSAVFSVTGVQLQSGYIDLFFFNGPGIIADRGLLFLLIGTIIITAAGINRGWIPLAYLCVFGFLVKFAGDISGLAWNGDLLYGLFSGGTVLTAFVLAAEPSSGAKSRSGVFTSVVLCAILAWFLRYKCSEFFGAFVSLSLINCFTPLIRLLEDRLFFSGHKAGFKENIL